MKMNSNMQAAQTKAARNPKAPAMKPKLGGPKK